MNQSLGARWSALWARIGAVGDANAIFADLTRHYAQPRRFYHNLVHVEDCLEQLDAVRAKCRSADAIETALWFHDAIYDSRAKDNEEQSAQLAGWTLAQAGVASGFSEAVKLLVLATKHNAVPAEPGAQIIVDVDLSILGRAEAAFDAYDANIRREYAWVPEDQYRTGRTVVLKSFLARIRIFSTEHFHNRYEAAARRNIERALARLA